MALVSGLIVTMAMIGGMVAQTPLTLLVDSLGWRHALMVDASVGLVIVFLIYFLMRDYPVSYAHDHEKEREQLRVMGYWRTMRLSFLRRQNWLCGIYTSLMNLPIFLLGGLWGTQYLERVHHLTVTRASYITSMLFLGTIIGSPTMGWLSDRMGLRRRPMIFGAIFALATIWIFMVLLELTFPTLLFLFLLLGFITSTQIISYPLVTESNTKLLTATSVSVVSLCAISGGAVFEPLFGWLMDQHWHGLVNNGHPVYLSSDFQFAMMLFPVTFVVALFATLLIRETYCKRQVS